MSDETTYQKDLVTVLIPTYNQENYIGPTIQSVLDQTYRNLQIIVLDDGSADATGKVALQYQEKDSRVRVITGEPNVGFSANMNKGFKLTQGEFVAKLDGDDIMLPERIEEQVHFLRQNPDVGLCHTDMMVFDSDTGKDMHQLSSKSEMVKHPDDFTFHTNWFFVRPNPNMVLSSALSQSVYFLSHHWDERVPYKNELVHSTLIAAERPDLKWAYIPKVLSRYRFIPDSMSRSKRADDFLINETEKALEVILEKQPSLEEKVNRYRSFFYFRQFVFDWLPKDSGPEYIQRFRSTNGFFVRLYAHFCRMLARVNLLNLFFYPWKKLRRVWA